MHLTETCEADTPHFITHIETTLATDQDVTALAAKDLLPAEHLLDGAYLSADGLVVCAGKIINKCCNIYPMWIQVAGQLSVNIKGGRILYHGMGKNTARLSDGWR